ncbi:MAG: hypothetical protein LBF41_01505 [Deltaproteobacteria bacterium]|nr:hypothetical protein [Deltaproteobacteria bacterium]
MKYGLTYFLHDLAVSTGLLKTLREAFPNDWKRIFALAAFLVHDGKEELKLEDFMERYLTYPMEKSSSQKSPEPLPRLNREECQKFFREWSVRVNEKQFAAFDSDSVPLYVKNNSPSEYRETRSAKGSLSKPMRVLWGRNSKTPVCFASSRGNLNNVSSIGAALKEFKTAANSSDIWVVNSFGVNVKNTLEKYGAIPETKFISNVPPTDQNSVKIIDVIINGNYFQSPSTVIRANHDGVRGMTWNERWYSRNLHAHVYLDRMKDSETKMMLDNAVNELTELFVNDKLSAKDRKMFIETFLTKTEDSPKLVCLNNWLVLITNQVTINVQEAYDSHIAKIQTGHALENYFEKLDALSPSKEKDERFGDKSTVAFAALVLDSRVNRVMTESGLCRVLSRRKVLRQMAKLRAVWGADDAFHPNKPLTETQKIILTAFDIEPPNRRIINRFIKKILD